MPAGLLACTTVRSRRRKAASCTKSTITRLRASPSEEAAMLKTGAEHLKQLRDGRVVYIGSERVDDVTTHPAFRNAARTVAAMYDMKAAPENREAMSFE